jgi:hypothetical protein
MRALLLILLLGGCGTSARLGELANEGIDGLNDASRAATSVAGAYLCRAIRIEVWRETFNTPEKQAAWNTLCPGEPVVIAK